MYEKIIELLGVSKASDIKSVEYADKARKLLEEREMARHEPNTYPRNRLPSPIAIEDIKYVSDTFGVVRHVHGRGFYAHSGIDIPAPIGTPITLPAKSIITAVRYSDRGWGNRIYLRVLEGAYKGWHYAFCHCSWIIDFDGYDDTEDYIYEAGALVGRVGITGNSTGPHLHLMIGNNLGFNGYALRSDLTTTIGFDDPVSIFNFEGCRWG